MAPRLALLIATLVLSGCTSDAKENSTDGSTSTSADSSATTDPQSGGSTTAAGASGGTELDSAACELFNSGNPDAAFVAAVPAAFTPQAQILADMTVYLNGDEAGAADPPAGLLEALVEPSTPDGLRDFATAATTSCGEGNGIAALEFLARGSELGVAPADDSYCAALTPFVDVQGEQVDVNLIVDLPAKAPEEHRASIEAIVAALSGEADLQDEATVVQTAGAFVGLGIYGEARCGVPNALYNMFTYGLFASF